MNLSATSKSFYKNSTTCILVVVLVTFLGLIPLEIKASERPSGTIGYLQQLEEKDWILKVEALHYLSENNVNEGLEKIFKLASNKTENSWIRSKALTAYCKIQNGSTIPPILTDFSISKDSKLRAGAAEAEARCPAGVRGHRFHTGWSTVCQQAQDPRCACGGGPALLQPTSAGRAEQGAHRSLG